jgi:hypothetical protein
MHSLKILKFMLLPHDKRYDSSISVVNGYMAYIQDSNLAGAFGFSSSPLGLWDTPSLQFNHYYEDLCLGIKYPD